MDGEDCFFFIAASAHCSPEHAVIVRVVLHEHLRRELNLVRPQALQKAEVLEKAEQLLHIDGVRFVEIVLIEDGANGGLALLGDADGLGVAL